MFTPAKPNTFLLSESFGLNSSTIKKLPSLVFLAITLTDSASPDERMFSSRFKDIRHTLSANVDTPNPTSDIPWYAAIEDTAMPE